MPTLSAVLLALTLVLSGGYAGIALMVRIGILPGLCLLTPGAYADSWRAMDKFMDRRMPPYKLSLLLLSVATFVMLCVRHRMPLAVVVGISFLLNLSDLILTVRQQLPLNAKLHTLSETTPDDVLIEIRDRTVEGIGTRFLLSGAAFVLLCFGAVLYPVL